MLPADGPGWDFTTQHWAWTICTVHCQNVPVQLCADCSRILAMQEILQFWCHSNIILAKTQLLFKKNVLVRLELYTLHVPLTLNVSTCTGFEPYDTFALAYYKVVRVLLLFFFFFLESFPSPLSSPGCSGTHCCRPGWP